MWIIVEKMGKKGRETAETGGRTGEENQEKIRFSTNLSTVWRKCGGKIHKRLKSEKICVIMAIWQKKHPILSAFTRFLKRTAQPLSAFTSSFCSTTNGTISPPSRKKRKLSTNIFSILSPGSIFFRRERRLWKSDRGPGFPLSRSRSSAPISRSRSSRAREKNANFSAPPCANSGWTA